MRPIDADRLLQFWGPPGAGGPEFSQGDICYSINAQPTLDVAPVVHASWYGQGDGYADGEIVYDEWFCGNCGHCIETDDPDELPKFCPNCGAKMEVSQ